MSRFVSAVKTIFGRARAANSKAVFIKASLPWKEHFDHLLKQHFAFGATVQNFIPQQITHNNPRTIMTKQEVEETI